MAKKRVKINAKNVLAAAASGRVEKRNITFRIESGLLDKFIKAVGTQDVSANLVVETLIREFVDSFECVFRTIPPLQFGLNPPPYFGLMTPPQFGAFRHPLVA